MTTLNRLVLPWTGPQIKGNAVTVLHWDGSDNAAPPVVAVSDALQIIKGYIPSGVSIAVPNTGDRINDTTGELEGVWSTTGGATVPGTASAQCAAGVGACITWTTGGIVQGARGPRKLRGRTFIVPLSYGVYEGDGTIEPTTLGVLRNFAAALQAAGPLAIWHRPTSAGAANGTSYGVLSNSVRDKVAFLKSRRD